MRNFEPELEKKNAQTDTISTRCPICDSERFERFQRISQVPVFCNVLWRTDEAARSAPLGDIDLTLCGVCGHIFNSIFDPKLMDYDLDYENSLHYSPRFQDYANALARDLIERHDLHGKTILEIGSGKGDFLKLLCDMGSNRGYGFDPSYAPSRDVPQDNRITFVRDVFGEKYAGIQADFICSRHTLEHVFEPVSFMTMLRNTIGDRSGTGVYIEVPNVDLIVKDLSIWDIIYEHYSYFSSASLQSLMERAGFIVKELNSTYDGQFLSVDAVPSQPPSQNTLDLSSDREDRADYIRRFSKVFQQKIDRWMDRLAGFDKNGKRVVLWGAGSKGVSFLNMLRGSNAVHYVVDINPRKLGMHISGTGQEIIPPERLREYDPDVVIIMNPIYQDEIRSTVRSLGLEPEYLYG